MWRDIYFSTHTDSADHDDDESATCPEDYGS